MPHGLSLRGMQLSHDSKQETRANLKHSEERFTLTAVGIRHEEYKPIHIQLRLHLPEEELLCGVCLAIEASRYTLPPCMNEPNSVRHRGGKPSTRMAATKPNSSVDLTNDTC